MKKVKIKLITIYLLIAPFIVIAQWFPSSHYTNTTISSASFLTKDSFIVSLNGRIFQTKNGGETFDSFPDYPSQIALNLVYKSTDTLFVARETTKGLLCSYDAGKTWLTQTLLMPNGDTAFKNGKIGFIGFFDKNHGIIFGDTLKGVQQVFLTQDGGQNWAFHASSASVVRFPSSSRSKMSINNYLFASGIGKLLADSKLLTFMNYGREWSVDSVLPADQSYSSIAFKDEQNGLARISIPLRGPVLFKTSDGGKEWLELPDSSKKSNGNLLYVKPTAKFPGFFLASTAKSVGESNVSYDDGQTWQLFDTLNHGSGSVFFFNAEAGVCSDLSFTGSPVYYYKPLNTGIKQTYQEEQSRFIVYPNPAQNSISFSQTFPSSVQLWDLQGKLIASDINTNQLDISSVPNGLYIVKVIDGNQIPATQKLVIQH